MNREYANFWRAIPMIFANYSPSILNETKCLSIFTQQIPRKETNPTKVVNFMNFSLFGPCSDSCPLALPFRRIQAVYSKRQGLHQGHPGPRQPVATAVHLDEAWPILREHHFRVTSAIGDAQGIQASLTTDIRTNPRNILVTRRSWVKSIAIHSNYQRQPPHISLKSPVLLLTGPPLKDAKKPKNSKNKIKPSKHHSNNSKRNSKPKKTQFKKKQQRTKKWKENSKKQKKTQDTKHQISKNNKAMEQFQNKFKKKQNTKIPTKHKWNKLKKQKIKKNQKT